MYFKIMDQVSYLKSQILLLQSESELDFIPEELIGPNDDGLYLYPNTAYKTTLNFSGTVYRGVFFKIVQAYQGYLVWLWSLDSVTWNPTHEVRSFDLKYLQNYI